MLIFLNISSILASPTLSLLHCINRVLIFPDRATGSALSFAALFSPFSASPGYFQLTCGLVARWAAYLRTCGTMGW